jgi:hypothetical protein
MFAFTKSKGSAWAIFNRPGFNTAFSFIIGFGILCIIRPLCKGKECMIEKAPDRKEFESSIYKIKDKCYKFSSEMTDCPATNVIEPFRLRLSKTVAHQI